MAAYLVLVSIIILFVHLCHRPLPPNLLCFAMLYIPKSAIKNLLLVLTITTPPLHPPPPALYIFIFAYLCFLHLTHKSVIFDVDDHDHLYDDDHHGQVNLTIHCTGGSVLHITTQPLLREAIENQ